MQQQQTTPTIGCDSGAKNPLWLVNFIHNYQELSTDNLHLLEQVYHQDVVFEDPLHKIVGLTALKDYFDSLYENLLSCQFVIEGVIYQHQQASVFWYMHFKHPKLNKGERISVSGCSLLKGEHDKVIYHRDYLDVGAMLYEHIPVLGAVIKKIKHRASQP